MKLRAVGGEVSRTARELLVVNISHTYPRAGQTKRTCDPPAQTPRRARDQGYFIFEKHY